MPTPAEPDEPIRSGREFDERMFPPVAPNDSGSLTSLDPEELGAGAALQAIERLHVSTGRTKPTPTAKRPRKDG